MKALYQKEKMLVNFKVLFTHTKKSVFQYPGRIVLTAKFNLN